MHYRSIEARFPDFPGVQSFLSRHRVIFLCITPAPAIPDVVYLRKPASHWVVRDEQFASICALLDRMPSSSQQHIPSSSSSSSSLQQQSRPLNGPKVAPLSSSPPPAATSTTSIPTTATSTSIPTEEDEIDAQAVKQADETNNNPTPASTQSSVPALSAADQERLMAPPADTPSDQIVGIVQGQEITTTLSTADKEEPSLSRDEEVSTESIAEDALHDGSDHIAMNTLDEIKDDDNTASGQNEAGEGGSDDKNKDGVDSSVILQAPSQSQSQSQESTQQNHHNSDTAEATMANSKSLTMKLLESGGDIRALLSSDQPLLSLRAQTVDTAKESAAESVVGKDEEEEVEEEGEEEEQRFVRPPRLRFTLSKEAASDGFPSSIARSLRWHPDHMQDRPGNAANLSIRAAFDTKFDEYYVFRHWRPSQGRRLPLSIHI